MTYMLNKLLNLTEKGKYLFAPCLCPVQASQLSMSRFILIEINIHISVIFTSGQEAFKVGKTATKCYPNTVSKYYDPVYFISYCPLENLSYLQTLLICSNKWKFRSTKVRNECCLHRRLYYLPSCRASSSRYQNFLVFVDNPRPSVFEDWRNFEESSTC